MPTALASAASVSTVHIKISIFQGTLAEREGLVQLTSLYQPAFDIENIIYFLYNTGDLNEEDNRTEPPLQLVFPAHRQCEYA